MQFNVALFRFFENTPAPSANTKSMTTWSSIASAIMRKDTSASIAPRGASSCALNLRPGERRLQPVPEARYVRAGRQHRREYFPTVDMDSGAKFELAEGENPESYRIDARHSSTFPCRLLSTGRSPAQWHPSATRHAAASAPSAAASWVLASTNARSTPVMDGGQNSQT